MLNPHVLQGRALPLGDDVSTDILHPPEFFGLDEETIRRGFLAKYDPSAASWVQPGDIIVAGRNFGCGSSREVVVRTLVLNGITAIVATSFARIFFRSCMNLGIACLSPKGSMGLAGVDRGERLTIDLQEFILVSEHGLRIELQPLPPFLVRLREGGGILGLLS
jgi:3-isopropylmalate dehydratase small subunit